MAEPKTHFEMVPCGECEMLVKPAEYHPYAACVMYRQLGQVDKVTSNLHAVVDYGIELEQARQNTKAEMLYEALNKLLREGLAIHGDDLVDNRTRDLAYDALQEYEAK